MVFLFRHCCKFGTNQSKLFEVFVPISSKLTNYQLFDLQEFMLRNLLFPGKKVPNFYFVFSQRTNGYRLYVAALRFGANRSKLLAPNLIYTD
jgi:hypothetical protein